MEMINLLSGCLLTGPGFFMGSGGRPLEVVEALQKEMRFI